MIKITNLDEIKNIKNSDLKEYIKNKAEKMINEYNVESLNDIGCFVVLEKDEISEFSVNEMEFAEVLEIGNAMYLHGVRILGDSYGEDIFMPVEVVKC